MSLHLLSTAYLHQTVLRLDTPQLLDKGKEIQDLQNWTASKREKKVEKIQHERLKKN